jgi:photosynthetic reaction center cytochrome c subunit
MIKLAGKKWLLVFTAIVFPLAALWNSAALAQSQTASAEPNKTAEQQFKNIQVLKDIPADQLIPTMQFISASLGVQCDFCHVDREMQKDDKKEKQTARKMIAMELAINKGHFNNEIDVTCYTCHRGSPHPVGTPILGAEALKTALPAHEETAEDHPNLPSADQLLEKYLTAVGGANGLLKIKSRVQKGTIDVAGTKFPIDVYSEAPDKRVSVSHFQSGSSITAFNGQAGWLTIPNGVHLMTGPEREAARIDAQLYLPLHLKDMYQEFKVRPGEEIGGHATYLLMAKQTDRPTLSLYFDQQSGLLLRQLRLTETPLGRNPTQVDYADYRETDGVKIPYRWTLTRPNGSFTINVDQVQDNVPIDPELFEAPSEKPPTEKPAK